LSDDDLGALAISTEIHKAGHAFFILATKSFRSRPVCERQVHFLGILSRIVPNELSRFFKKQSAAPSCASSESWAATRISCSSSTEGSVGLWAVDARDCF
jgi:hypothetical protein